MVTRYWRLTTVVNNETSKQASFQGRLARQFEAELVDAVSFVIDLVLASFQPLKHTDNLASIHDV